MTGLTAFYVRRFDRVWKMQAYFLKGFADGSPNWGAGVIALRSY